VANHPNQWFQASVNYHKIKNGGKVTSTGNSSQPSVPSTAESTVSSFQPQTNTNTSPEEPMAVENT
jgi:hypothetical protein